MAHRNSAGKWVYDDKEVDAQIKEATKRGAISLREEPHAKSAQFDEQEDRFVIELTNGVVFMIPRQLLEIVADATPEAAAAVTLDPLGEALHWQQLDQDLSIVGLVAGIFGTRRWMAQLASHSSKRDRGLKSLTATAAGSHG